MNLLDYVQQTRREKSGTIDGLNLFFGALIGANLGTLDGLALAEYVKFIALLAGAVVALRLVSTSDRRGYALATMGLYGVIIAIVLSRPAMQPAGLARADLHHLIATFAVWVGAVLTMEFWPTKADPDASQGA